MDRTSNLCRKLSPPNTLPNKMSRPIGGRKQRHPHNLANAGRAVQGSAQWQYPASKQVGPSNFIYYRMESGRDLQISTPRDDVQTQRKGTGNIRIAPEVPIYTVCHNPIGGYLERRKYSRKIQEYGYLTESVGANIAERNLLACTLVSARQR